MRTISNLIFWQGNFSIHQSALLRNLAAAYGIDVTLVVWEELPARHSRKGWSRPNYGQARIILRPTSQLQSELLSVDPLTTFHIFDGTRGHAMIWNAFRQCSSLESHIGIQYESYRTGGIGGGLRFLRGRYDALRFAARIDFILGIGTMAVEWFKRSGYPAAKIFPFAYFVETPSLHSNQLTSVQLSSQCFDLIFVGRPLFNKGLDILLRALSGINKQDWRLHIVGDQDDRREFARLSEQLGLTDSVFFYGTLPNEKVIDLLAKSDLLVLPSRWDGWGAVVNEALMCGVPAVCSDRCGAADLLDGDERGEVFSLGDIVALRSILARRISREKKDAVVSQRIREWSKCIDGRTGADYLLAVIDAVASGGSRPVAPWLLLGEA